jgi:micrococcal nuclease
MDLARAHRSRRWMRRLGFVLMGAAFGATSPALGGCGWPAGLVEIVAVNDRLDVNLADGRTVRIAGLDLPQPDRGDPRTAQAAHDFLAARLIGQRVELDLLTQGTDRWDRVMADLFGPGGSIADAILQAGFGRVRPEFETRSCAAGRLAEEEEGRRAGRGIWRDPEYAVVSPFDLEALQRRAGQFVIIEGRVRRVGFGRSRIYLDLGRYPGPTIVIARKLESAFAQAGSPLDAFSGQTIRARGVLDDRYGLRLEVGERAMIEVLRRSGAEGANRPPP